MTDAGAEHHLEQLMASACCVVAVREDVGSITIVVNRRLTFEALVRMRDHAAPCHMTIAKDGHWLFRVRRQEAAALGRKMARRE